MSCPNLHQTSTLQVGRLIGAALLELDNAELETFLDTHMELPGNIMLSSLEERIIHYRLGSMLAAEEEWNRMTRLQLKHELRLRRLLPLDDKDDLTDWQLRLRLAAFAFEVKQEAEEVRAKKRKRGEEECDDRRVIYTKKNGQTIAF